MQICVHNCLSELEAADFGDMVQYLFFLRHNVMSYRLFRVRASINMWFNLFVVGVILWVETRLHYFRLLSILQGMHTAFIFLLN